MRWLPALLLVVILIGPASAVVLQPGVELNPTGSLFYLVINYTIDTKGIPVVVEENYVKVGGITIYADTTTLLKIVVDGWYPENVNKDGETVFDLVFVPDQPGRFAVKFAGLTPHKEYTIYKDNTVYESVKANSRGEITFSDSISDETHFVIKCGAVEGVPVLPPPPEEYEFPWWLLALALLIVIAGVLYWRRR